jgi:peptidoglycan/LPS O-acetylase OafA/YrhL
MAVEEQFYVLWPLVVWLCPNRRALLRVTILLIGFCCIFRFSAFWIHVPPELCYVITPARVDAILLGVLLALIRHDNIYKRIERLAKYAVLAGVAVMVFIAIRVPGDLPATYPLTAFEIPLVNFTAAAVIVAVLEEASFLHRICSIRWVRRFGSLSYALYVFHLLYLEFFIKSVPEFLAVYFSRPLAYVVSALVAFCLTLVLAVLSHRFIEGPAMNLKKRIRYGPFKNQPVLQDAREPIFQKIDF